MRSFEDYRHVREVFNSAVPVHWETDLDKHQYNYTALFTVPYVPKDNDYDSPAEVPAEARRPIQIVYKVVFTGTPLGEDENSEHWFYSVNFEPDSYNTDLANPDWPSTKLKKMFTGIMGIARRNLGAELSTKVFSALLEIVGDFIRTKKPAILRYIPGDAGLTRVYQMLTYKLAAEYPEYGLFNRGYFIRRDVANHPEVKFGANFYEDEPIPFEQPRKPRPEIKRDIAVRKQQALASRQVPEVETPF